MNTIIPRAAVPLVLVSLLTACNERPAVAPAPTQTNTAVTKPAPNPQFTRLLGRWQRPDGGYVLELRSVDAAGQFEAAYLNPNPIHVERATAVSEDNVTKVNVLLRDANYPGCTYTLTYDPKADQLYGLYYQAAIQQTFDVTFARLKTSNP